MVSHELPSPVVVIAVVASIPPWLVDAAGANTIFDTPLTDGPTYAKRSECPPKLNDSRITWDRHRPFRRFFASVVATDTGSSVLMRVANVFRRMILRSTMR